MFPVPIPSIKMFVIAAGIALLGYLSYEGIGYVKEYNRLIAAEVSHKIAIDLQEREIAALRFLKNIADENRNIAKENSIKLEQEVTALENVLNNVQFTEENNEPIPEVLNDVLDGIAARSLR